MPLPQPHPGVLDIAPYVGGASTVDGCHQVIKLSSNESPLGPSPRARQAFYATADRLHAYPDGGSADLRQALASHYGLDPQRVLCSNGSEQLIGMLVRAYAGPGDEILFSRHGFLMYEVHARAAGAIPVRCPERNLYVDVDELLAAVTDSTRIVFVTNPGNPTGTYIPASDIYRLRENLREDIILAIDSAYAEYVGRNDYDTGLELAQTTENTVMLRTFSKIYGLAGLRVGWGYFPCQMADATDRVRCAFNVSTPAQAAAVAALQDTGFTALARAHNDSWLPWLNQSMQAMGLKTTDSVANFILVHFPADALHNAGAADHFLRTRGIIVRPVGNYGLPDWLRITVGTDEENRTVVDALRDFLQG